MTPPLDHHDQYALHQFNVSMCTLTRHDPKPSHARRAVQEPPSVVQRVLDWVRQRKERV